MTPENSPRILTLPGWGGSGPAHWQSLWERDDPAIWRVEQDDWENPDLEPWLARLEETVGRDGRPVVLVAHSLACALVAHWAAGAAGRCAGALLVAPADVDSPDHTPFTVRMFSPLPTTPLPFPSIVVGSEDDLFMDLPRARQLAEAWGSRFVNAGAAGHINADSGYGAWPQGKALLESLLA